MTLESSINKATSSELTEDDYGQLLDIVDLVKSNPDQYISESIDIVKDRLESNNANVILRTITLIDFLAENCGAMMRGEIAKKSFVNDYLVKLVKDNHTHTNIKYAIIKEIYKLSETFKGDDSLRIMSETFRGLKPNYSYQCQQAINEVDSGNRKIPTSNGGFASQSNNNDEDEDEELKKAIELSLKEAQVTKPSGPTVVPSFQPVASTQQQQPQQLHSHQTSESQQQAPQQPPPEKVIALYDLESNDEDTLSFKRDDIITVVETVNNDWIRGCLNGELGIIPVNYVKKIPPTTDKEIGELVSVLNNTFNIEVLLSKLMDLNTKLKSTAISNQEFQNILLKDSIPQKMNDVEKVKEDLKKILDLYKLKILELESMDNNVDAGMKLYQRLITEHTAPMQPQQTQSTLGQYPTGYNQMNSQMGNLNLAGPTGGNFYSSPVNQQAPQLTGYTQSPVLNQPTTGFTQQTQLLQQPAATAAIRPMQQSQATGYGFQNQAPLANNPQSTGYANSYNNFQQNRPSQF